MDLRSGEAYWQIRNGLLRSYPPLDADEQADVAVVGGGITGALVALALVEAGANVVVVDRRDVVTGSSAATTGLLMYETDVLLAALSAKIGSADAARAWNLGRSAIDEIQTLARQFEEPCGFARRPAIYCASRQEDVAALQDECTLRRQHGFDVEWLSAGALAERYGITSGGGILSRGNGEVDCYRLTHAVLQLLHRRGARIYDRTEVTDVGVDAGGVLLRTNRGPVVRAARLVWATGYEGVEDVQRRVGTLHSTWVVASEPAPGRLWGERALLWETARPYLYARTTDDSRVLIGGEDEPFHRRHANERIRHRKTSRLIEQFRQLVPDTPFETAYEWAGVFSTTADGLPYIGAVPEHPHAWLALGYGGNGITFSMIAAGLIRDAWAGVANQDARLFAFER